MMPPIAPIEPGRKSETDFKMRDIDGLIAKVLLLAEVLNGCGFTDDEITAREAATALQSMKAERDDLLEKHVALTKRACEYRARAEAAESRLSSLRTEVIEECAKVAEGFCEHKRRYPTDMLVHGLTAEDIASQIRSLSHAQPIEKVK